MTRFLYTVISAMLMQSLVFAENGSFRELSQENQAFIQTRFDDSSSSSRGHRKRYLPKPCKHHKKCKGPTGATGPTGAKGNTGDTGAAGPSFGQYASFFSTDALSIPNNQNFLFDTQKALSGITYDSNTGVFTINQAGVYKISAYVYAEVLAFTVDIDGIQVVDLYNNGSFTVVYTQSFEVGQTISIKNIGGTTVSYSATTLPMINGFIDIQQIDN